MPSAELLPVPQQERTNLRKFQDLRQGTLQLTSLLYREKRAQQTQTSPQRRSVLIPSSKQVSVNLQIQNWEVLSHFREKPTQKYLLPTAGKNCRNTAVTSLKPNQTKKPEPVNPGKVQNGFQELPCPENGADFALIGCTKWKTGRKMVLQTELWDR